MFILCVLWLCIQKVNIIWIFTILSYFWGQYGWLLFLCSQYKKLDHVTHFLCKYTETCFILKVIMLWELRLAHSWLTAFLIKSLILASEEGFSSEFNPKSILTYHLSFRHNFTHFQGARRWTKIHMAGGL